MTWNTKAIVVLTVLATAAVAGADVFSDLAAYNLGDPSNAPDELDKVVLQAGPDGYAPIEAKLIEILQNPKATNVGKRYACRMLQRIGTKASVPALAGLLGEKILSHYARLALQRMTSIPEAGAVLRAALTTAPDAVKPGIIASVGERRDAAAVGTLAKLLASTEPDVQAAALMALGKIGGGEALAALQGAKVIERLEPARREAVVVCAANTRPKSAAYAALKQLFETSGDDVRSIAALREMLAIDPAAAAPVLVGLIGGKAGYRREAALRLAATAPGQAVTDALAAALGSLKAPTQARLVALLGTRGDRAALPAVKGLLSAAAEPVKLAAIGALAELGGPAEVPALLAQAKAGGAVGEGAMRTLARMGTPGVDEALIAQLKTATLRAEALKALAQRGCRSAGPAVLRLATDPDPAVRMTAWEGMGQLAGPAELPALMKIVVGLKDKRELAAAQGAVRWICTEAENPQECFETIAAHYQGAAKPLKLFILELGPSVGIRKALDLERAALNSGEADLREKALRAMMTWPNPEPAETLLALAKEGRSPTEKILALRGYIQVAATGGSDADRAGRLKAAADLARRADDKRLLIARLRDCRHVEAFRLVGRFLEDAEVRAEAQSAAIDIASRTRWARNAPEFEQVLTAIIKAPAKKSLVQRAKDCIARQGSRKRR